MRRMMRATGLNLKGFRPPAPKAGVSTNSTTPALPLAAYLAASERSSSPERALGPL